MFDPRVWTKPFVGVVMAAIPWHLFDNQVGEKEIERVEHFLQIVCIVAVMRWMYVERYGDEATKLKYWHRGFWAVTSILVLSVCSRTILLGGVTVMDVVCATVSCVPFVIGLLWKRQDNGQETETDKLEEKQEMKTATETVCKRTDTGQKMQPPMMKEVKQPDEALQQMRTVTLKVNKFIDQTMRHGSTQESMST
ncbi:uncharacterized protein LOC134190015 [Corticium candelabrum]|uniref:uncharacterized protein LOC134190015 n=1 Tax=Corticium candelabrum TaxID=121492 RepID=UPI002E26E295|nr:uncharacterized protein LOC134190015 [Corticium candelabrum]